MKQSSRQLSKLAIKRAIKQSELYIAPMRMTNQRRTMLNTIKNNNFVSKEESAEKLE